MLMVQRSTLGRAIPVMMILFMVISAVPAPTLSLEVSDEIDFDTSSNDIIQRVDGDGSGNFHVIYSSDAPDNDFRDILYRKVAPDGTTLKGPLTLTPTNQDAGPGNNAIAVDDAGRAHVVMVLDTDNTEYYSVFYAQVGADGTVSVPAKKVYEDDVASSPYGIDVETDTSGSAYVVWHQTTDPPTIMWAKLSASGSITVQPKVISGDLQFGGTVSFPRLGVTSSGDNLIAWQQKTNQLERLGFWFTRLSSGGAVEVDPMDLMSSALAEHSLLEATVHAAESELHIVYVESNDVSYAKFDQDGDLIDSREIYADLLLGQGTSPDIAVAKNGDVYISYGVRENANDPWDLFAQVYWYDDDTWEGPEQVNDAGSPPSYFGRPVATNNGGAVFFTRAGDLEMVTLTREAANRPPVPVLTFYPTDPSVDETVTFDGRDSTDPDDGDYVDEYNFEYGDGSSSGWVTTATATHVYAASGTYTARLRVRDSQGLESTSPDTASVTVTPASTNKPPTAVLTANPTSAEKDEEVTFSGTSSFDTDGVVSQYLFTYGDGTNSGWVSTGTVKHAYTKEGVFTATLKVQDDDGADSAVVSAQVTVLDTNEKPTASITSIEPNPAMVGDDITFVGTGTDPDGTIAAYSWESDMDGPLGNTASVTAKLQEGTHTIIFKVQDDDGDWSDAATQEVVVKANSPFTIEDETVLPKQIYTDTLVEFRVTYTDPDNDRPNLANLVYSKGANFKTAELREVDPGDTNYADGKEYYFNKKFDEGKWKYYFEFRNSKNPKKSGPTPPEEFESKAAPGPLPGWESGPALGAMAMVAATLVVLSRRRKLRQ